MNFNPNFFPWETENLAAQGLMDYLQEQQPETLERIAQGVSDEVKEIISQNVQGLVGMLPTSEFNVQITTDRQNLANLLASAMMTGYFIGQVERRHALENIMTSTDSL
ncbi:MAG: hypothetical protein N5P05_003940 [Chroococcopsis gigantea SAG 12.99]|jgi:CheY-specific phosphatase CheX|nr:DUF760 domain-containing protein [Chlorogloea purpurea SAG 13.99]MDV3002334.1 hypothetical protein [Chroococcopsis gigantea SAG 12.99]